VPVGTGLWIAGGNNNIVRRNHFWDTWRRGVMLFSVPDAFVCGPLAGDNEQAGCDETKVSTSHRNSFYENVMGVAPSGMPQPNGTDFWWDSFLGNRGNCWYDNKAAQGRSITTSPPVLPDCSGGKDRSLSIGTTYAPNELELVTCLASFEYGAGDCNWFETPAKPTR
jgi:hypothetical protein